MAAAMTAGVLATTAALATEWPVADSAADEGSEIAAAEDNRTPEGASGDAGAASKRSIDAGNRAADRSTTVRGSQLAGRLGDRTGVSRSGERNSKHALAEPTWLAGCGGDQDLDSHPNGTLPDDELCALPTSGHHLRPSAARAWWRLDAAYQEEFGTSMCVTDSYRSLDQQEALAVAKPGLAAQPGTSNHGWGVALDMCGGVESFGTTQYEWLSGQAAAWGWENPDWAQEGGSKPEPWHWEYVGRG